MREKSTTSERPWIEANQAYLVAELDRLKRRLGAPADRDAAEKARLPARPRLEPPPAIDHLAQILDLSAFERDVLLLCAGVELDSGLAARCAEVQGYPQRTSATFGLALAVLAEPHWSALAPIRPLRHYRLVELEPGHGLTAAPLRIDERVLHYLTGVNVLDARLESLVQASPFPDWIAPEHRLVAEKLLQVATRADRSCAIVHLRGDDPRGQEDAATFAAHWDGRRLFTVRAEDLPAIGPELDQFAILWQREALLAPAALLIQGGSDGFTAAARHLAERLPGPLFLASREPVRLDRAVLRFDLDKPGPGARKRLWENALGTAAGDGDGALDALSEQFRLSARMISTTAVQVGSDQGANRAAELWKACRSQARPGLEDLAQRIVPSAGWDDLVLPELQAQTLRQIAAQARHRLLVYETWGFAARGQRGLGLSALFIGESGTGKTMAAEVLAGDLALDLYRIDLASVVSKYIGETEKNLKQLFDAAEEGGALLLFDEADALFGKRSEVKDSHDRYANIEVSYLLQRMEAYQGLAILTTNLKSSLDKAFQRRLRFTVGFPFPDAAHREAIWRRVFPPRTPTHGLDVHKLAQLNVAGGNIRNIALNAAFLAADSGEPVGMAHLLQATRLEAQKIERPLSEAEIRGWT